MKCEKCDRCQKIFAIGETTCVEIALTKSGKVLSDSPIPRIQDMCDKCLAKFKAAYGQLNETTAVEVQRLQEIVDRLPRSANGVPITAGAIVECPKGHRYTFQKYDKMTSVYCVQGECWDDGCQSDDGSGTTYAISLCKHVGMADTQ